MASTPEPTFEVTQLNGHTMQVMTAEEAAFYTSQQRSYMAENAFTAVSDLADLDRVVAMELRMFRLERFLNSGADYSGSLFSDAYLATLARQAKALTELLQAAKQGLGLTRSARDKAKGESIGDYITNLALRAKAHGIKRETELQKGLALVHQLISLIETYDRSNAHERGKLGIDNAEELVDWIRMKFIPDFRAVDDHFRANEQRYWVGTL